MKIEAEIYALSGKLGSGKDYIAKEFLLANLPKKNTLFVSFADHFKIDAISKFGMEADVVFGFKPRTAEVRKYLQIAGTEEGRLKYGEDIWIKTLEAWMYLHSKRGVERFIITDCRFPNEKQAVESWGGKVIRVLAPSRTEARLKQEAESNNVPVEYISQHPSETSLDNEHFDYVIHNDINDDVISQLLLLKLI